VRNSYQEISHLSIERQWEEPDSIVIKAAPKTPAETLLKGREKKPHTRCKEYTTEPFSGGPISTKKKRARRCGEKASGGGQPEAKRAGDKSQLSGLA